MRRRFGRRFGRVPAGPVSQSMLTQRKKTKCAHCGQPIPAGTTAVVLRLRKAYKVPCDCCGVKPRGKRVYHDSCFVHVGDINAAMHVDPNKVPASVPRGSTVAPPPVPPTPEELGLKALASLEEALIAFAQRKGVTAQLEKEFKTYQGIKARALRPGTPEEGKNALSLALQRAIKLVIY